MVTARAYYRCILTANAVNVDMTRVQATDAINNTYVCIPVHTCTLPVPFSYASSRSHSGSCSSEYHVAFGRKADLIVVR